MTKRPGRKPRGDIADERILFAVLAARFGKGGWIYDLDSSAASRLRDGHRGHRITPHTNLSGAFATVEDDLRRRGIIKDRLSEGLAERGTSVRRAYYRAEKKRRARNNRYLELLAEEYRQRRVRPGRSVKRVSDRDLEIRNAARAWQIIEDESARCDKERPHWRLLSRKEIDDAHVRRQNYEQSLWADLVTRKV